MSSGYVVPFQCLWRINELAVRSQVGRTKVNRAALSRAFTTSAAPGVD